MPSEFSFGSLPRWTHDFECCTFDHSDNSPYKILPEISSKNRQEIGEINRRDKGEMKHHCFGKNLGKSRVSGSGSSIMEVRFRDRLFPTAFSKNFFAAQRQLKYYSIFYFWYASSGVQFTQKSFVFTLKCAHTLKKW